MEARVILAKMLWNFDWELGLGGIPDWDKKVRWNGGWKLPSLMVKLMPAVRDEGSEGGSVELLG